MESNKISEYFKLHPEINLDELYNEGVPEFMDLLHTASPEKDLDEAIKTNAIIRVAFLCFNASMRKMKIQEFLLP